MIIAHSLTEAPKSNTSYVLTIGNFDGVHLGHKAVLDHLKAVAYAREASTAVITFANHPSTILFPEQPIPMLCTLQHKIRLLQEAQIEFLSVLPFTRDFSNQTVDTFLKQVQQNIPLQALILGQDATLGKDKTGDRETVQKISKSLGFETEYLPDTLLEGERISSSKIRELIRQGKLEQAAKFLGRKFSIYAPVISGTGRGTKIGFPTANIAIEGLCVPPLGVYAVSMKHAGQEYLGVANLGYAPTLRKDRNLVFEVHLFGHTSNLYNENVEVIFGAYIRPEQRFDGVDQLKLQIAKDIKVAQQIHGII